MRFDLLRPSSVLIKSTKCHMTYVHIVINIFREVSQFFILFSNFFLNSYSTPELKAPVVLLLFHFDS